MGLFNKLKEILFDEETVEIPVITKEEKEAPAKKKHEEKRASDTKQLEPKRHQADDDEVIIRKIETPKREDSDIVDTLFDMPKFKDDLENPESQKEKKVNTLTFPVFSDDDRVENTRRSDKKKKFRDDTKREEQKSKETRGEIREKSSGYTNAYDYSYGKYKGDYMSSREENKELVTKTLEEKEEKKAFSPSPIISPVYGVLNENYKKEDIISKKEKTRSKEILDLDSVRRKAYGTLEDDIEASLTEITHETKTNDTKKEEEIDLLEDDGISIDDLLVDDITSKSDEYSDEPEEIEVEEVEDMELFSVPGNDEPNEEIDIEPPKHPEPKEPKDFSPIKRREPILDTIPRGPKIPEDAEEIEVPNKEDESIKEEDLFDLIDSLYEGKEED